MQHAIAKKRSERLIKKLRKNNSYSYASIYHYNAKDHWYLSQTYTVKKILQ